MAEKRVLLASPNWGLIFKLPETTLQLVSKIRKGSIPLTKYFPSTSQGLIAYDKYQGQSEEIISNRVYHSNSKEGESYKKWLHGGDVTRYSVNWNGQEYIDYCDGIANPRDPKFFLGKRILIREITNPSIFAGITENELYNDPAIIIVLDNPNSEISIYTVLAILNSKLATYFHFNSSPKATKGAFPKILVDDINNFPIPREIDYGIEKKIHDISIEILSTRQTEPTGNRIHLEEKLDKLVYRFYGLTYEEALIVDPDLE